MGRSETTVTWFPSNMWFLEQTASIICSYIVQRISHYCMLKLLLPLPGLHQGTYARSAAPILVYPPCKVISSGKKGISVINTIHLHNTVNCLANQALDSQRRPDVAVDNLSSGCHVLLVDATTGDHCAVTALNKSRSHRTPGVASRARMLANRLTLRAFPCSTYAIMASPLWLLNSPADGVATWRALKQKCRSTIRPRLPWV